MRLSVEEKIRKEGERVRDAQVQLALAQAEREEEELHEEAELQGEFAGLQDGGRRDEVIERGE